ncbi:MAG: Xaa-Pro aminopeptidase [Bacteroidetes bacterium QH_2_64_74]|nr:MAG: Xaa-Pro aminopeptidase [Bacteroidetes bacterium QH_2_64_74]
MFDASRYCSRRRALINQERPQSGLVLLLGNQRSPRNYPDNPHPFRQDSTFLYYFGLDRPDLYGLIDLDAGTSTLYGEDGSLEDAIWSGDQPSLRDEAAAAGIESVAPVSELEEVLTTARSDERALHFLPPYRAEHRLRLESLLGIRTEQLDASVSEPLIRAVVRQRSVKTEAEIDQIETAVERTVRLHEYAQRYATPGTSEREILAGMTRLVAAAESAFSFTPTCSVRGEVLHNHSYPNTLARQRAVYEAVLAAQSAAIEALAPGVPFKEIHLLAARTLTEHLIEIGLMQGDPEAAVDAGAHALFFPHGLGHMMGLDVHDMESLGEDYVGYADDQTRSEQFGLHTLRLARPLQPGFVATVEPGCYFIPPLVERWRDERRHASFINYDRVEDFLGLGGVRLEDDVLITEDGTRMLGPALPKAPAQVEARAGSAVGA